MMLQVIAAGFFTVVIFFKSIRAYFKQLLTKKNLSNDSLEKNHEDRG